MLMTLGGRGRLIPVVCWPGSLIYSVSPRPERDCLHIKVGPARWLST